MNETDEIKQRLPIEQLVGSYVPLKKMGRIYKANCPFHQEKTPSFTVSPERGIFKCFGCGKGGDIFDFVMDLEGLTFPETVKLLAERAGVTLEEWKPAGGEGAPKPEVGKDRLFRVNAYAAKLWNTILISHEKAAPARDYLKNRGLTLETMQGFQLGYAPFGSTTAQSFHKAEFTPKELQIAGDPTKFQDRITFPICDITGRIIGFTGRLLELKDDPRSQDNRGPKYWNTPETPIFIKSRAVYNIHLAKQAIQREDLAILAEGQMDVAMLYQSGYEHTVASSGTALTTEQIKLIGRFTTNIAFAYDQDKAGIEATKRGIELVLQAELNPFVIVVPNGKDPAECLRNDPDSWHLAYQERYPFMEWLIRHAMSDDENLTPLRKKELAKELLPWVGKVTDQVERTEWLRIVAAYLQTDVENLQTALERMLGTPSPTRKQVKPEEEHFESSTSTNPLLQKAELALAFLLAFPDILPAAKSQLDSLRLAGSTPFLEEILPILEKEKVPADELDPDHYKQISLYVEEILRTYQTMEIDSARALEEVLVIMQRIRSDVKESTKSRLAKEISNAQLLGDTGKLQSLFAELKNLI
jgi:DNA primase